MMERLHYRRGAALVETAVMLSFTLLMLFGSLQFVMVGYLQTASDGAVFLAAHEYAIGQTNPQAVASAFPGVNMNNVSFVPASPPPITMPDIYNEEYGHEDDRHGGAQTIRPQRLQAKVQSNPQGLLHVPFLPSTFPVNGGGVEGRNFMSDNGYDVYGYNPNSLQTWTSMIDPIKQDDQNVPPYYIGLHDMFYCQTAVYASAGECPKPDESRIFAAGLAEYLDNDNYGTPNGKNGVLQGATFYAMAYHQRVYASILSGVLPVPPASPSTFDGAIPQNQKNANYHNDPQNPTLIGNVYHWGNDVTGKGSGSGEPLNPPNGSTSLQPLWGAP